MPSPSRIKRISKAGISAVCRSCESKQQIPVNQWYSTAAPRCSSCGGPLDRIHARGKFRDHIDSKLVPKKKKRRYL